MQRQLERARHRANVALWHLRHGPRRIALFLGPRLTPGVALGGLFALALTERLRVVWRRLRRRRPRLIWGTTPIINLKYWSRAMRHVGYESRSAVYTLYAINERADFDVHWDELIRTGRRPKAFAPYRPFTWALRNGDVFLLFFDGGFLRGTPLEWWEYPLMRLAGKKIVVSPYGADIAVPGHLRGIEDAVLEDYPSLRDQAPLTERRVLHALKHAHVSVLTHQQGFQPTYNAIWGNQLAIDTDLWSPRGSETDGDGRGEPVVVVHAPNHRATKGTHLLERAVSELEEEGLRIDLRIYEGRPSAEVREAVLAGDIVADQFLMEGYGQFAVEGMAAGKPVLANFSSLPPMFHDTAQFRDCPIVDVAPATLKRKLGELVQNPALRSEIGRASRDYVLRYHSYDAVGRDWAAIVEFAWTGARLPRHLQIPDEDS